MRQRKNMNCVKCNHEDTRIINTSRSYNTTHRHRLCNACHYRFRTCQIGEDEFFERELRAKKLRAKQSPVEEYILPFNL